MQRLRSAAHRSSSCRHTAAATPRLESKRRPTALAVLSWMFLRLLVARATILKVLGHSEVDEVLEQRRRGLEKQAQDESAPAELRRSLERPDRDPASADRPARRGRQETRLHRCRDRAHRGTGRTDPGAGGALNRSRDPVAAHRRDHRHARWHRPVDPRSAAGLRRDGGSADRTAAADATMPARRRASETSCHAGQWRCGTCSAPGRRRSSSSTATSSTWCPMAASCSRCRRFSTK